MKLDIRVNRARIENNTKKEGQGDPVYQIKNLDTGIVYDAHTFEIENANIQGHYIKGDSKNTAHAWLTVTNIGRLTIERNGIKLVIKN